MLQKLQFVELAILTWILLNSKYEFMELINDYIKHKIIGESKC